MAAHTFISASDKDFPKIFEKLCLLSTIHLFEFAKRLKGVACPYENQFEKIAEVHETVREDVWLDQVYGA